MDDRFIFRGKITHDPNYGNKQMLGQWAYGSLVLRENCSPVIYEYKEFAGRNHVYNVDKDTIGQCSGLRDVKDKLIFEGDLLKFIGMESDNALLLCVKYCVENARWQLKDISDKDNFESITVDDIFVKCFEVVGSIYDSKC